MAVTSSSCGLPRALLLLSAALLLFVVTVAESALPRVKVDRATGHFIVPETGNRLIFHGANSVKKSPPFYSEFSDEELDQYAYDWGMNVIRLGLTWEALEPERGNYNMTYLEKTRELVARFEQRGVYTLLDMHQDLYGPKICGNGFPDWSVITDPLVASIAPFPIPVMGRTVFEYGPDGRITGEDCGKLPYWSFIYFTAVTGSAFQSFYDDARGVQTAFIEAWKVVASYFAGSTAVLGLELINEPWPGSIYREPGLLVKPGYADGKHLAPLYDRLHAAIRPIDEETLIFYEPHVSTSQVLPFSAGFERGPGGAEYDDRQVFSFHHYCPTVDAAGVPSNELFCDWFAKKSIEVRVVDTKRLGGGGMLTEWGVFNNVPGAIVELQTISKLADDFLISWAYWDYKTIVNLSIQNHVTYTYLRKIAGIPISMDFDPATSTFVAKYSFAKASDLTTEIYLNEKVWYPAGFNVEILPLGQARWSNPTKNSIVIDHSVEVADNTVITVTLTKI